MVLLIGAVGVYFMAFRESAPVEDPAVAAAKVDSDSDGVPDVIEGQQGTDPRDKGRFPAYEGRPASHKKVLVARVDVPVNVLVKEDFIDVKEVPMRGGAPDLALLEADRSRVVGRISQTSIKPGEFIMASMVYGGKPQLSYLIPQYKRGVTLRYNQQDAVGGLIQLGDVVDVIGHFRVTRREGSPRDFSWIICQNVRIVAKGEEFLPRAPEDTSPIPPPTSITVSVYPHEAERLIWAENYPGGRLVMALRSPTNDILAKTLGTTDERLFGRGLLNEAKTVDVFVGARTGEAKRFDPVELDRMGQPVDFE